MLGLAPHWLFRVGAGLHFPQLERFPIPGGFGVGSRSSGMCGPPGTSDVGLGLSTPLWECHEAGWGGGSAAAAGEFLKHTLSVSFFTFLYEKFLLLKPATPYKEGPVLSHSPPLQLDQGLSRLGPVKAQLSTLSSWHTHSPCSQPVCLPLRSYSPPCDFKLPGLSGS